MKEQNKRLAIQLFGYLRSFKQCYESFFENVVKPFENAGFEVDIFMHSWDFVEGVKVSWSNENAIEATNKPEKTPSKEDLKALYRLKDIAITAQPKHKDSDKFVTMRYELDYAFSSILGSYCSVYSVNALRLAYEKQHNLHYDLILCTRADLFFHRPFSLHFLGENTKNKLFGYYGIMESEQAGLDQFYLSTPCVINALASLYLSLDYENLQKANLYNPEGIMQNFLVKNGIEILCLNDKNPPFKIKRSKDYEAFRKISQNDNAVFIAQNELERLRKLEHFNEFVKFYWHKRISHLRRKTRFFRYPIKKFFTFGKK